MKCKMIKICISHIYFPSELPVLYPRCGLILDQGNCRDYSIRWYYDKQANACAQFWYGGCGGNDNRYETEDECKKTCVQFRIGKSLFFTLYTVEIYFPFILCVLIIILSCPQLDKMSKAMPKMNFSVLQSADIM